MAPRKAKPAAAAQKTSAPATTIERRATRQAAATTTGGSNPNQMLREAAWSRMFGRIETKNPFTH
jgi:hypothetical protein